MVLSSTMILQLIHPQELTVTIGVGAKESRGVWVVQAGMTAYITDTREGLHAVLALVDGWPETCDGSQSD
jgi:hypothetical protein